jgi:glycosyltransferase involved in cell wall biosynthesis
MKRSALLFLSPIMPNDTGNGLAMRAGIAFTALARRFDVHLGLIPVAGGGEPVSPMVQRWAASVQSLPLADYLDPHYALIERVIDPEERRRARFAFPKPFLCRFCTSRSAAAVAAWCEARDIRAVHVLRLYLAPFAEKFQRMEAVHRPFLVLDLDEDEVATRHSLAALHHLRGAAELASAEEHESKKYATLMTRALPYFDRALVSSPVEAQRVLDRSPIASLAVIPNAAPRKAMPVRSPRGSNGPARLLFVGNLGYPPNEDATEFLCREILPRLRSLTTRPFEVIVAGGGASSEIAAIAKTSDVTLRGPVGDLSSLYADTDVAVVPLRAGGGTRIKVLEAFAYGVPVVATPIGMEGIAAVSGEHAMIAETPESFAEACLALVATPRRAEAISTRALRLAHEVYRAEIVEAALLALYDSAP